MKNISSFKVYRVFISCWFSSRPRICKLVDRNGLGLFYFCSFLQVLLSPRALYRWYFFLVPGLQTPVLSPLLSSFRCPSVRIALLFLGSFVYVLSLGGVLFLFLTVPLQFFCQEQIVPCEVFRLSLFPSFT